MKVRAWVRWCVLAILMVACNGIPTPAPVTLPSEPSEPSVGLADQLDAYLTSKGSPLAGHGANFVASGQKYGVDPRLIIAIAGAETSFGTKTCAEYNAWNWFYKDTSNCTANTFTSWAEGIDRVTRGLGGPNYLGGGLTTIEEIGKKYTATQRNDWIRNVTIFYHDELGGDLNNLAFKESDLMVSAAPAGATPFVRSQAVSQSAMNCDVQIYYGIKHCTDNNGKTHIIEVTLNDSHVRLQTVLPVDPIRRSEINPIDKECKSVNRKPKDPSGEGCGNATYPVETIESMLARYKDLGAVAIINTDYFGSQDLDHGAQGLAVRKGVRLDSPAHGVLPPADRIALKHPSLAFSPSNRATIGIPGSQAIIDANLNGIYYNTVAGAPIIVQGRGVGNVNCAPLYPPDDSYPEDTCSDMSQSAAGLTGDGGRLILITAQMNAADIAQYLIDNYQVHTALKFDGGGSASMAWVDSNEIIQCYKAENNQNECNNLRSVAEGLLIFSEKIPTQEIPLGAVSGLVSSDSGKTVEGATVEFVGEGKTPPATTGRDGRYLFSKVPAGNATVRASKLGEGSGSVQVTVVANKQTQALDISLKPGLLDIILRWIWWLIEHWRDLVIWIIAILTFPIWFPIVIAIIRIMLRELER